MCQNLVSCTVQELFGVSGLLNHCDMSVSQDKVTAFCKDAVQQMPTCWGKL